MSDGGIVIAVGGGDCVAVVFVYSPLSMSVSPVSLPSAVIAVFVVVLAVVVYVCFVDIFAHCRCLLHVFVVIPVVVALLVKCIVCGTNVLMLLASYWHCCL